MDFKKLFTEDRAVSPVIGVILMVAITVILAAVIGAFVLGLGDQVSERSPSAQFTMQFDGTNSVTITHDGGESIDTERLTVLIDGEEVYVNSAVDETVTLERDSDFQFESGSSAWDDTTRAGSSQEIVANVVEDGGEEDADDIRGSSVRLIWEGQSGSSSTLRDRTWP